MINANEVYKNGFLQDKDISNILDLFALSGYEKPIHLTVIATGSTLNEISTYIDATFRIFGGDQLHILNLTISHIDKSVTEDNQVIFTALAVLKVKDIR